MNETSKSVGRSVSMPEAIWSVVDAHAAADPTTGDRSSYILRLVASDLDAAGKLPGSTSANALAKARAIIAADPRLADSIFTRALLDLSHAEKPEGKAA